MINKFVPLVNTYKPLGSYEVEFDGTGLQGRVCFYRSDNEVFKSRYDLFTINWIMIITRYAFPYVKDSSS